MHACCEILEANKSARCHYIYNEEEALSDLVEKEQLGFLFCLTPEVLALYCKINMYLLLNPFCIGFKLIQISLSNEFGESLVWKVNLSPNGVEAGVHS